MAGEIPKSVAEHWDVLWWLVALIVVGGVAELRMAFHTMCKNQKNFMELHYKCQKELPEKYVGRKEFDDLREDRTKRWERYFFGHTHYPQSEGGGVKIHRGEADV